jgi:Trk K+ transport system NAD-binding subunit
VNSALFIALRRLRQPIIALVVIYAVGMIGLVLIPGVDEQGREWRMSLFDAFYFISYTANTIGFGELPRPFSYAQRLWVTFVIYLSVLGWAYAIANLLALGRDRAFRQTLTQQRFERAVRRLGEPFYLVCGIGETGTLVCRALDRLGVRFVAIDIEEQRVAELDLLDLQVDPPVLAADAGVPENLIRAGLKHPACRGLLSLTSDDSANLSAAIATKLLHPEIPVLARAMDRAIADNMASFGTDHIINPFEAFGDYLWLAIHAPGQFRLATLLTGLPGSPVEPLALPPHGAWIVCGYGRFGREVVSCFNRGGMDVTIIEPDPQEAMPGRSVRGTGTEAQPLLQAGVLQAVGIVAGTDDDVSNLSIAVTARQLNPSLFVILRQNLQANRALFDAFDANMQMVPSRIIGHRCLALLTTPLLARFLAATREQPDAWAEAVADRIRGAAGARLPHLWSVVLNPASARAVHAQLAAGAQQLTLDVLLRDPADRNARLDCLALLLERDGGERLMPEAASLLRTGDRILFAGRARARRAQAATLQNVNVLDYVHVGREVPGGWVWERLIRRRERAGASPLSPP